MNEGRPICHVVAGPDGSGKSTFALRYLPRRAGAVEYVNPDLIAQGDSPLDIRLSAYEAARRTLRRIRELIGRGNSFGFETTLSGRGQFAVLEECRRAGFELDLWDRLAADRKTQYEDELRWIDLAREAAGKAPPSAPNGPTAEP